MLVKIVGISLHLLSAIRDAALHKLPAISAILSVTHGLIVESHSQALLKAL